MANRNESVGLLGMLDTSITDTQVGQLNTLVESFMTAMGRTTDPNKNIVFDGDSHTVWYLAKLMRRVDWNLQKMGYEYLSLGASGKTLATCVSQYAGSIAIYYNYKTWFTKNRLILWAGTNDIEAGTAVATILANYSTYISAAQATGYEVILIPQISRNYTASGIGALQKKLNACLVNDAIFAGSTGANEVVTLPAQFYTPRTDYGSDAAFQTAWDALNNNTTYYDVDRVHLKESAYGIIADTLTPVIQISVA